MNNSFRQKLNREIMGLTGIQNPMDLIDIYKAIHLNKEDCNFLALNGTFFKTDLILSHKANLNRHKKI